MIVESTALVKQFKWYMKRNGNYPESVIADKIYRNRENLQYCEAHGIRLNGPRLDRTSEDKKERLEQRLLGNKKQG